MSDENERSVASAGCVAGEPVAWAALRDDGDIAWIGYTPEGAADGACGRKVVPLYRQPPVAENATTATLTDAEREALEKVLRHYEAVYDEHGASVGDDPSLATIRAMLNRFE